MGIIAKLYVKHFVCRYDKEVGVPYYSYSDFPGLKQETSSFVNSKGVEIKYFFYHYEKYNEKKIILFCHGIGPGHTAYLAEIEALAKHGYKVLTLDYTGCGESGGNNLGSLNAPTRDVIELVDYLKLKEEIVLVGHSLGGYTALNVINIRKDITKAIIMSGFLSVQSLALAILKKKFIVSRIMQYEQKTLPQYYDIDNTWYLETTTDKLFFIQSEDDQMVPYSISLKVVEGINNPNIKILKVNNRKHNPNYTDDAVAYMNEVFGQYNYLLKKKKIKSDNDKIAFFKDVSLPRLTEQDGDVINQIISFIK